MLILIKKYSTLQQFVSQLYAKVLYFFMLIIYIIFVLFLTLLLSNTYISSCVDLTQKSE